jgi:hypothetical protein
MSGCLSPKKKSQAKKVVTKGQQCLDFFYQEKPIHPLIIKKLISDIEKNLGADFTSISSPIADLNITALSDAQEFSMPIEWAPSKKTNSIFWCRVRWPYKGCFGYQYLGKLKNNMHVLLIFDDIPDGSAVFMSLIIGKLSRDQQLNNKNNSEPLMLSYINHYDLGDRDTSEISLNGNDIFIGPSCYREEGEFIHF